MSYVRVDSSVPRNRKFQQAGPAPSWLWLCGLAYCQEGLTDGFIPQESIDYLGVKNARRLADHLVRANLWEKVEGGWNVHDYLQYNKSASQVAEIKKDRREAGRTGGKASGEARSKQLATANVKQDAKHASNPYVDVAASASEAVFVAEDLGAAFFRFQQAYPASARRGGKLAEDLFFEAVNSGTVTVAALFDALDNHKASEQWQTPRLIPSMLKWFEEQRWTQRLDAPRGNFGGWKPAESA